MQDTRSIGELIAAQKEGYALEQRFYTDPDIYALELERIISKNWILAGHQSELPDPGDFKVIDIAEESAIIVRGQDGVLKAFANVCRHRGSKVCLERTGNTRKFECPYHGWMYDNDGNLTAARAMGKEFDKTAYGLRGVSLDLVHGLMFICFSDSPPSLDAARRDLAEPMDAMDFERLKIAAHKTYPIPANWKLSIENYQECYHCATAHPEYSKLHTLMVEWTKRDKLQKHMLEKMESCGLRNIEIDRIDTAAPEGQQGYGYSRTALFEGYKSASDDGEPVAPLLGKLTGYDGGASDFVFGPFSFLLAYSDHVVAYVFTPVDHTNCQCDIYWLVRGDAEEGRDYDVGRLTWLWDITTEADKTIIVNNWKGVKSRYYEPGPFSNFERAERAWVEWVLRELGKEG